MCILFLYTCKNPARGSYKLILASNRDETYSRPTSPATFWAPHHPNIIGGKDLEVGKEGGTWLGMSRCGRIGALLNIFTGGGGESGDKSGRGFLVNNFLHGEHSTLPPIYYSRALSGQGANYNPFSLITIDLKSRDGPSVTYYSNYPSPVQYPIELNSQMGSENENYFGFGNSLFHEPFRKVEAGVQKLQEILKNTGTSISNEDGIVNQILNLLKCPQPYHPDPQILKQGPNMNEEFRKSLSSKYVSVPSIGYGSRTHTIILVDDENRVLFQEWTMGTDGNWHHSRFEFSLTN